MGILLGFAPFIVFALLTGLSVHLALWAALAASFVIGIRDFAQTRILRVLDMGSVALFGLLALYTGFIEDSLSVQAVRLVVDGGLMTIALVSILIGNPFTLDYAREQVPEEFWRAPLFLRTNYVVAGVWVIAFGAMTAADAAATFSTHFPVALDIAASLATLALAVVFTTRYPAYVQARAGRSEMLR
ncbi:MAG TPA: hypothetical protein VMU22_16730 [Rhizomicrobium sp.]|nr:hypothetical protein [Rhizomicrobium sp.]